MARVFEKISQGVRPLAPLLLTVGTGCILVSGCDGEPDIVAYPVAESVVPASGGSLNTGGAPSGPITPTEMGGEGGSPSTLELTGDLQAHDPEVVVSDAGYFLFFTGNLISAKHSTDLLDWRGTDDAFGEMPPWVLEVLEGVNDLWAPDVSFFGGQFHLYYAASTFGTGVSCIGHATVTSLDTTSEWQDEGYVICSDVDEIVDWDAIDPGTFIDDAGNWWMVFGSYSSGIKLIALDSDGGRLGAELYSLASRVEEAIQAPAMFFHEGYYYLFASFDQCCAGISSTSNIRVGRSTEVTGPFVDKEGTPLLEGGGSLYISGDENFRAVGGSSFFTIQGSWYAAYHAYDVSLAGQATLRIVPVVFDDDGWPLGHAP